MIKTLDGQKNIKNIRLLFNHMSKIHNKHINKIKNAKIHTPNKELIYWLLSSKHIHINTLIAQITKVSRRNISHNISINI